MGINTLCNFLFDPSSVLMYFPLISLQSLMTELYLSVYAPVSTVCILFVVVVKELLGTKCTSVCLLICVVGVVFYDSLTLVV